MMNDQEIIEHMIKFIMKEEKRIINQKYSINSPTKNAIAKTYIEELEKVIENED